MNIFYLFNNKYSLISILIFSAFFETKAQQSLPKNNAYIELGGNGLYTSLNYERMIFNNLKLGIHVGLGRYKDEKYFITVPFGVNYLLRIKKTNSFFDFGIDATYSKADVLLYINVKRNPNYVQTNFWNIVPSAGYRKHTKHNFMYRFAITPIINQYGLIPYIGFSFGKLF